MFASGCCWFWVGVRFARFDLSLLLCYVDAMTSTVVSASGLYVPKRNITVCNIREVRKLAPFFEHVATVGPSSAELYFTHRSHIVETFEDSLDHTGPTLRQVENLLNWYSRLDSGSLLVHCHAGVSRSTGMAVGFHLVDGASAHEAVLAVMEQQPFEFGERRVCWPNGKIVGFLDLLFQAGVAEVVDQLCN